MTTNHLEETEREQYSQDSWSGEVISVAFTLFFMVAALVTIAIYSFLKQPQHISPEQYRNYLIAEPAQARPCIEGEVELLLSNRVALTDNHLAYIKDECTKQDAFEQYRNDIDKISKEVGAMNPSPGTETK